MSTHVRHLSPDVVVAVTAATESIDDALRDRIAAVWAVERARRPELFEGTIFACRRVDEDAGTVIRLEGHFVPYSWYVAATSDREIAAILGLWALGVSSILRCPEGIVLGRRASTTSYGGLLELVPSGAVDAHAANEDRVDLHAAILGELAEELALSERDLEGPPATFALVEDEASLLYEAGFQMSTTHSFADIERAHAALATREHDHLQLLTGDSADVIEAPNFSPTSAALLRAAGIP